MLTAEGATALWENLGETYVLRVSDGTQTASTIATSVEIADGVLTVEGEFDSSFANFEWRQRDVALVVPGKPDVTIDREPVDLGRKAEGSVWTLVAKVELVVGA